MGKSAGKIFFVLALVIPFVVLAYVLVFPKDMHMESERAMNRLCQDARSKVDGSKAQGQTSGAGAGMSQAVLTECEKDAR